MMFSLVKTKPLIKLMTSAFYADVVSFFVISGGNLMLLSLAIVFLVGLSVSAIVQQLKLPRIIGMLAVGIITRPYVLDLLDPSILGISSELRQIALIIILIKAGLSLDLFDLKNVGRPAVMMSFVPACFEILGYLCFAPILLNVSRIEAAVMGAVSKAFTALSVLVLQEEGKLSINDSVSDYLSWFDVKWQVESYDLKIWQLLNHTSGIPESQTYKQVKIGTDERLKEDTARIAEGIDLGFEPGTEFEYCNLNYDILAYLVEVASGERFEDYVAEEIFAPIGMTETGYDIPTAQGYQRCFWQTIEYDAPRFKGCQGDGYVITTTADMSLWIKAQLGQLELPEKLEKAIEKSHRAEDASQYINAEEGADCYYLNGWMQEKDGSYMEHSGGNPNFSTMLYIDRERNIGTFAATNISSDSPVIAARSAYKLMTEGKFEHMSASPSLDSIAATIAVVFLLLLVLLVVLLLTQKKRLAKKAVNMKKEKIRLIILSALLVLCFAAPYLIGYNYLFVAVWLSYSALIALTIIDLDLILMIVTSITRYSRQKHQTNE